MALVFASRPRDDLVVRSVLRSDAGELHAAIEANREHLAPWMPWAGQGPEGTAAFVAGAVRDAADGRALQCVLVWEGAICGACGCNAFDWLNHATSLGYWLARDAQGRGLMTAAVGALCEHAFGALELHRLEIRAAPTNARSRALAERLGFREEGVLRGAERIGGVQRDLVVYGRLRDDPPPPR